MTIIPSNEGLQAADVIAYVESGGTKTFTVASEDAATIAARSGLGRLLVIEDC